MNSTQTANDTIAARIQFLVSQGASPVMALRAVCGDRAVDQMIDSLYYELRAKGGRS